MLSIESGRMGRNDSFRLRAYHPLIGRLETKAVFVTNGDNMIDATEIPDAELFADLQVSLTEIFLIQLFDAEFLNENRNRLNGNYQVRDAIKGIMKQRFIRDDVRSFLENGFPRRITTL